jgi:transcriptional repressor NrdR
MRCPECKANNDIVIDSRTWKNGTKRYRRRLCQECDHRFSTSETVDRKDLAKAEQEKPQNAEMSKLP